MKVQFRGEALDDLRQIRDWYAERNPTVARTMIARIRERLEQLAAFPQLGEQAVGRSERTLFVARTPLVVVYRLEADADLIEVIAVIDARRDPVTRYRP